MFKGGFIAQELMVMVYALYLFVTTGQRDDKRILWAVAGLLYVATPFDAIPDCIPVAGYLDDAFVVSTVVSMLAGVLSAFMDAARVDIEGMSAPMLQWIKDAGAPKQPEEVFFDCSMDMISEKAADDQVLPVATVVPEANVVAAQA